jgi:SAM-dependent methyltransferase
MTPIVLQAGRLQQCNQCQHHVRVDAVATVDYSLRAIRSTYTPERLAEQIAFLEYGLNSDPNIFELGCARGELASAIREKFSVARYDGLEISTDRKRAAQILDTLFTDWSEVRDAERTYDLIIASHVLEHLPRPAQALEAMVAVLAPEGRLFVEVPNGSGHPKLPFDTNPGHLHHFNVSSLGLLLAGSDLAVHTMRTGAFESQRYPDSIRVLAGHGSFCKPSGRELGADLKGDPLLVWGAGGMAAELLSDYFEVSRIDAFLDRDPEKWGGRFLGKRVLPPENLTGLRNVTLLISSIDHEAEIRREIETAFADQVTRVVTLRELLQ